MDPETIGRLYDKVAAWWNEKHFTSIYGTAQIQRAIHYCKEPRDHGKALDVGCGSGGRIVNAIIESGFTVWGIDVSPKMLNLARASHPNVRFELADICSWVSDERFDLIVAWDSIFHLAMSSQEAVVRKLCGYLAPDGILIFTFGDDYGDHESLSFQDQNGHQAGELENDLFGYGTIGIAENLRIINDCGCKCCHLEFDQYPEGHVYIIARKMT